MNEKDDFSPLILYDGSTKPLEFDSLPGQQMPTEDLREAFAELSKGAPLDRAFEQAFLLSKIRMLETHPGLDHDYRNAMLKRLYSVAKLTREPKEIPHPPGGVGYGAFFHDTFRALFNTGTVLAVDFIAPKQPGGNVSDWLYLTATNRTAKGVEAFVLYRAQDDFRFRVFDWARDDHWQTNIGFSDLGEYLTSKTAYGVIYQVLSIQNQTYIKSGSTWTNNVWLQNYKRARYDLVYSYDYTSSEPEQKQGWVGSWGPIVETFQDSYTNTNQLGFLRTFFQSRDLNNQWGKWALLSSGQSYIRNDNHGFQLVFLDANHSFAVH